MAKAKAKKTKSEPKKKEIPVQVMAITQDRAMRNLPPMREHAHYFDS
jgi:hypothetical protein